MNDISKAIRWAAALLLCCAWPAAAQEPAAIPEAPRLDQPSISLGQAVELALTHDPSLHLALKTLELERGVLQETSGAFDPAFQLTLDHEFSRTQLDPGLQRRQAGQRRLFQILATVFQRVADDLQAQLDSGRRVTLDCDTLVDEDGNPLITEGTEIVITNPDTGEETSIRCTSSEERALLDAQDDFLDALILAAEGNPELQKDLLALKSEGAAAARAVIEDVIAKLNVVAADMRDRLRRLGLTPSIQHRHTTMLQIGYQMPFRSGVVLTPTFAVQRSDEYLIAKRTVKDGFGGRSKPTTYQTGLGLQVDAPLLRGRGYLANAGTEEAAKLGVAASDADLRQTRSGSALRTLLDYWALVAAQQRVDVYEQSAGRFAKLSEVGAALLAADEVTRVDVLNLDARIADVTNAVSTARLGVNQARVALARDIGLRVERLADAPLASDGFPEVAPAEAIAGLELSSAVSWALGERFDLIAADRRYEASRMLLATAREYLRPRLDLGLTLGYLGFEENQHLGSGLSGAFFDEWVGPSVLLTLDFELPFGNNAAIGRFAQAHALENQSAILRANLSRTISTRVAEAIGDVRLAADAVRRQQEAVNHFRQTIEDETAKYQAGVSTIIDVILTEENLTGGLIALIDAQQAYASALARLRYETGTLVSHSEGTAGFDPAAARRLPDL